MRSKVLSIFLLAALLLTAACTTQAATPEPTAVPEEAAAVPVEEEPTSAPVEPTTLTVLAAASLTESFTDIGKAFKAQNEGVTVSLSFAGSQALAEQLGQGAEADVFASASEKYMTAAIDAERVNADDAQTFAHNRLVVILPKDNPGEVAALEDLTKSGLKIVLGDETVPVGKYALDFLDKASADTNYGASFKDDVLANVVSYEDNVKAVVTKVSLDEADAGICYLTDITTDVAESVSTIEIPNDLNTIATYPLAPIADSKNPELAQAFVDFVLSPDGQAILESYGFTAATAE
jgi:molybdate transport system substrate-binding protein